MSTNKKGRQHPSGDSSAGAWPLSRDFCEPDTKMVTVWPRELSSFVFQKVSGGGCYSLSFLLKRGVMVKEGTFTQELRNDQAEV